MKTSGFELRSSTPDLRFELVFRRVTSSMTGARFELAISRFLFIAKKLITHSAMHMSLALYQAELPRH